ncbi:MAG: hypothetical protein JSR26_06200 [Proteobacteria bacterium]|nr:hypothetical protein [Pseudomonadota bacterium]
MRDMQGRLRPPLPFQARPCGVSACRGGVLAAVCRAVDSCGWVEYVPASVARPPRRATIATPTHEDHDGQPFRLCALRHVPFREVHASSILVDGDRRVLHGGTASRLPFRKRRCIVVEGERDSIAIVASQHIRSIHGSQ